MKWFMCLVVVAGLGCSNACAQTSRYTVDELRSLLTMTGTMLSSGLVGEPLPLRLDVVGHADAAWIAAVIAPSLGDVATLGSSATTRALRITPIDVSTRYEAHEHADSVHRIITVNMAAAVLDADGTQRTIPTTEQRRSSVLSRTQALALQSKQYSCSWAELPPPATSFWQDVLEPAVFVGAAIVTTVLLFTVRSQ